MHIGPFHLKRAHHAVLSHLRRFARPYGLTPARYDLLYLLNNGSMRQSAIHKALGVTRATTSRMLISLEELGLIKRSRPYRNHRYFDRRGFLIEQTERARRCMRAIRHSIVAPWLQLAFECYFFAQGWLADRAFFAVDALFDRFEGIAKHFGDTSRSRYPSEDPGGPDFDLPMDYSEDDLPDFDDEELVAD